MNLQRQFKGELWSILRLILDKWLCYEEVRQYLSVIGCNETCTAMLGPNVL